MICKRPHLGLPTLSLPTPISSYPAATRINHSLHILEQPAIYLFFEPRVEGIGDGLHNTKLRRLPVGWVEEAVDRFRNNCTRNAQYYALVLIQPVCAEVAGHIQPSPPIFWQRIDVD